MIEADAVAALQEGDDRGLEALVSLHEARALRVAFAITGDRGAAEDVVAEAFVRAYTAIDRFDATRPFGPWLLRIVTRNAIKAGRRAQRLRQILAMAGCQSSSIIDPVVVAEGNELRRILLLHVRRLPVRERAAITLRYLLDMDERAVAETLGWPLGTLKSRLHRARVRLRAQLDGELNEFVGRQAPQRSMP